jgi:cell division GTPase FtsZ
MLRCLASECQAKSNRYRSNRLGLVQAATSIDAATICTVVTAGGAAALGHGKNAKEKFAIAKATKEENENETKATLAATQPHLYDHKRLHAAQQRHSTC